MAGPTYKALMKSLEKGDYAPVYLLHGEEGYYIDQVVNFIAENALSEADKAFNQVICYGKDVTKKQIVDIASQYPMMAQRRLVIIKEAQAMRSDDLYGLDAYAAKPTKTTILVIAHYHKKVDGRKALARNIAKTGIVFESSALYDNQVAPWIEGYLSARGKTIEPGAVAMLAEYVGTELSVLSNEIDKLVLTLAGVDRISLEHILEHVGISKEYNVFELQKAIGSRDAVRVERIVRRFIGNMKGHPVQMIIGVLYSYFTRLLIVRSMSGASDKQLLRAIGLGSPYFLGEYKAAARRFSMAQIEMIIGLLKKYDLASKGVRSRISDEALLREMIFEIMHTPVHSTGRASGVRS